MQVHPPGQTTFDIVEQSIPQALKPLSRPCRQLGRSPQRHDERDVLGAGAASTCLTVPADQRFEVDPFPHVQRGNPFGGIELVADQRQQVHPELGDIHHDLAHALSGIGMKQCPMLVGDSCQFRDRL